MDARFRSFQSSAEYSSSRPGGRAEDRAAPQTDPRHEANQQWNAASARVTQVLPTAAEARARLVASEKLKQLLNGTSIFEPDFDGRPNLALRSHNKTTNSTEMLGKLEDAFDIGRRLAPAAGVVGTHLIAVQARPR